MTSFTQHLKSTTAIKAAGRIPMERRALPYPGEIVSHPINLVITETDLTDGTGSRGGVLKQNDKICTYPTGWMTIDVRGRPVTIHADGTIETEITDLTAEEVDDLKALYGRLSARAQKSLAAFMRQAVPV